MKRVAVFYSLGPHFWKALAAARDAGDAVIAIVPPHLATEDYSALADEVVVTQRAGVSGLIGLVRQLKAARYDVFVILFDSPKQRVLARLVGAGESWYCAPHGRMTRVEGSVVSVVVGETLQRVRGILLYMRIWMLVRITRVKNPAGARRFPPSRE